MLIDPSGILVQQNLVLLRLALLRSLRVLTAIDLRAFQGLELRSIRVPTSIGPSAIQVLNISRGEPAGQERHNSWQAEAGPRPILARQEAAAWPQPASRGTLIPGFSEHTEALWQTDIRGVRADGLGGRGV